MTDTILRHRDMKEESEVLHQSFIVQINFQEIASTAKQDRNVLAGRKEKQQVYILGEML